ncbi:MAG: HD domain-containing protein [Magnetovibrio sp.]|nr:HD domain-containing protein [Magnetovibrio sp.]
MALQESGGAIDARVDLEILFVIDNLPLRIQKIRTRFDQYFDVFVFSNGTKAFEAMLHRQPAAVITDDRILSMYGNHIHRMKCQNDLLKHIPFFVTSDEYQGSFCAKSGTGAIDYFFKRPINLEVLFQAVIRVTHPPAPPPQKSPRADVMIPNLTPPEDRFKGLAKCVANHTPINRPLLRSTWNPLVDCVKYSDHKQALQALKAHSSSFYTHSFRVAIFMCVFAKIFDLNKQDTILLASAGYMCDLGIMLLPQSLLTKPTKFTPDDERIMQRHVVYGTEILDTFEDIDPHIYEVAELHHERLDGSGYPQGLKGTQISELGRIAAIADVFAALTDHRPYRPPLHSKMAFRKMMTMSRTLDQGMLSAFYDFMKN